MSKLVVQIPNKDWIEDCFKAGADEVIVGMPGFSIGALEKNALDKMDGTRPISVLCNRFFFPEDKVECEEWVNHVVHIYFSDPKIYVLAKEKGITDKLIYDPSTLVTSSKDVSWWNSLGIAGVCISPLLTKEEVITILKECKNCEISIHGHLLMSISKRKLLSVYDESFHLKKSLTITEETREAKMPIYEDDDGTFVYTDYVQSSFNLMKEFMALGCERYRILGEFLEKEILLDSIEAYRKILDGQDPTIIETLYKEKHSTIPFSEGYLLEKTIK